MTVCNQFEKKYSKQKKKKYTEVMNIMNGKTKRNSWSKMNIWNGLSSWFVFISKEMRIDFTLANTSHAENLSYFN